jgi:hypothetical protein
MRLRAEKVPGVVPIREKLSVGQSRAQQIRDYLQALQAAT